MPSVRGSSQLLLLIFIIALGCGFDASVYVGVDVDEKGSLWSEWAEVVESVGLKEAQGARELNWHEKHSL